jgi:hypothetical protein
VARQLEADNIRAALKAANGKVSGLSAMACARPWQLHHCGRDLGLAIGLYFVNAEKNRTELARQGEERQRIAAEPSEERAKTEAATATAVKDFLQRDLLANL